MAFEPDYRTYEDGISASIEKEDALRATIRRLEHEVQVLEDKLEKSEELVRKLKNALT